MINDLSNLNDQTQKCTGCNFNLDLVTNHFYKQFQLDLQLQDESGGDISSFVTNGEWELLGMCFFSFITFF